MDTSSSFETVKTAELSLSERVADQISQLIIEQHMTSQDRLPSEFELATQLNVGRGTIREAVKLLIARNVLVIRRGKGTYIADNPGVIPDPLGFAYYPNQLQLAYDLMSIRMTMEPWIARMAAELATEEEVEELKRRCLTVEEDILAGRDHLPNDTEFHISIANCMHNMVTPKLIPIITYSVGLFGSLNGRILLAETIIGHRAITDAIAAHDPDMAEDAMKQHLLLNKRELDAITEELAKS